MSFVVEMQQRFRQALGLLVHPFLVVVFHILPLKCASPTDGESWGRWVWSGHGKTQHVALQAVATWFHDPLFLSGFLGSDLN